VNQLYNNLKKADSFFCYISPTGSSVQAGVRQGEAQFTDRDFRQIADLDQGYKERELAADIEWLYSSKTVFSGHLGKIRREYHFDDSRDTYLTNLCYAALIIFHRHCALICSCLIVRIR
jgi:hypothetical protein